MSHSLSASEVENLQTQTLAAKSLSYSPYSNFRVGCALLTPSGEHIVGANVENASYPVSTCAERTALVKAVTSGHRQFKAVGVATDVADPVSSPCGMCRQALREFCGLDTPVFMFNSNGEHEVLTLGQLLPMSFGPDSLPSSEEMKGIQEQQQRVA